MAPEVEQNITKEGISPEKRRKRIIVLLLILIFLLGFIAGWLAHSYSHPCPWAKESLTLDVTPPSQVRGGTVLITGALVGEDVAGKTVTLTITDTNGNVIWTGTVTTDENGLFTYEWNIPSDLEPGQYTVTATYGSLSAQKTVQVRLSAPQGQG